MPNRRERREQIRNARRARQFISLLATTDDGLQEIRERRPPSTPVEQVRTLSNEQVIATDNITQSTAGAVFTWGQSTWGEASWGSTNV